MFILTCWIYIQDLCKQDTFRWKGAQFMSVLHSTQASPSCTCLAANWCEREWWSHIRNSYWGKNKILGWAACDRGACHTYYRNFKRSQQDFYQLYWKIAPILSPTNLPYEVLFLKILEQMLKLSHFWAWWGKTSADMAEGGTERQ